MWLESIENTSFSEFWHMARKSEVILASDFCIWEPVWLEAKVRLCPDFYFGQSQRVAGFYGK